MALDFHNKSIRHDSLLICPGQKMAAIIVIEGEFWTSKTEHSVSRFEILFGFSDNFHYFTFIFRTKMSLVHSIGPIHLVF